MDTFKHYFNIFSFPREKRNQFLFCLLLGFIGLVISVALENTNWGQHGINSWFDTFIAQKAKFQGRLATKPGLIILEIDDKGWLDLGKPDQVPRDKLAAMIDTARQGGAKLIVLDFNLSEADYTPPKLLPGESTPLGGQERDQLLLRALERLRQPENHTKLLLPVINYADLTFRENQFTKLIDDKNILGVTPAFSQGLGGDNVVRFWVPYLQGTALDSGAKEIFWSMPVTALAVAGGGETELAAARDKFLHKTADSVTLPLQINGRSKPFTLYQEKYAGARLAIRDATHLQYNRILYGLYPAGINSKFPFGNLAGNMSGRWRQKGIDNDKLDYKDKIVIIGRSDRNCNDFVRTPAGRMPGMYVHANSIYTLLQDSQPHMTTPVVHLAVECLLIFLTAIIFASFSTRLANLLLVVQFNICWILAFVYFYFSNEFVNLNFSFMGIVIYKYLRQVETVVGALGHAHKDKTAADAEPQK